MRVWASLPYLEGHALEWWKARASDKLLIFLGLLIKFGLFMMMIGLGTGWLYYLLVMRG
jgi:hypothetical protein